MRMILMQESGITRIFNEFIGSSSPALTKYHQTRKKTLWYRNRSIEAALDKNLAQLQEKLYSYLTVNIEKAWHLAADKTDLLVQDYISKMAVSDLVRQGLFTRDLEALKAFQSRRIGTMNLSERVWKICDQTKENIEFYLQSGVGTGRSAAQMSRDVRQLLNNPDARFRRIRDPETGKLKPSRPMASYHPGQGVYRSAYQNSLRMTRTETNMAYRMSDQVRWQKLDFVTGYEVKLSASHPVEDICDFMAGEYPKSFVFGGWHPNCYCYTVPIMMKQDQFAQYLETGKVPGSLKIKGIPAGANQFVKSHSGQFRNWTNTPYWLKDNFVLKNGEFTPRPGLGMLQPGAMVSLRQQVPNVAEAFNYIDSRVKSQVSHAMHAINMVHGDGKLPRIPIMSFGNKKTAGFYEAVPTVHGKKASRIAISYSGPWKDLTVVHETGHFLDHCGIGSPNDFETLSGSIFKNFITLAHKSKPIQEINKMITQGYMIVDGKRLNLNWALIERLMYLLQDQEVWARAYSQYIATKSGDTKLLRQVKKLREKSVLPSLWDTDDFVPLLEEIDKIFKNLGWLR